MKFFALVALALVATSNAGTVASFTATRASVVAGAAGGDLTMVFTASNAGAIAASGTVTITLNTAAVFTADGATACTATVAGATAPTFASSAVTGTAASAQVLTLTMNAAGTDILAADGVMTIVCTDNMPTNNAAAVATYTFSAVSSGDAVAATGSYTIKTTPGWTSAARGTGATNLMTGKAGGDLTFVFTPTTALPASGTITLTPSAELFTADAASACTATVAGASTAPTFASATVSGTGGTQIITFTLNGAGTDIVAAGAAATVVCTTNLAVNTAAGAITFGLVTSTDLEAATAQTGYTIVAVTAQWTSAARTSVVSGAAGGDLTVIFAPTTALPASGTITLTPSSSLFTADGATTCTASTAAATNPTFASATVSGTASTQLITFTLNAAGTDIVAADAACTIVCTNNLAVNGAAGAVTFSIATSTDATALTAQTGYTITAATSAASSTASVSMLTMLTLAAVAMRQ